MKISTSVYNDVSPDKVWMIFSGFALYPQNPFILKLEGNVEESSNSDVGEPPRGLKFSPRILTYNHIEIGGWTVPNSEGYLTVSIISY